MLANLTEVGNTTACPKADPLEWYNYPSLTAWVITLFWAFIVAGIYIGHKSIRHFRGYRGRQDEESAAGVSETKVVSFKRVEPPAYSELDLATQNLFQARGWFKWDPANEKVHEPETAQRMLAGISTAAELELKVAELLDSVEPAYLTLLADLAGCVSSQQALAFVEKHGRPRILNKLMGQTYYRIALAANAEEEIE